MRFLNDKKYFYPLALLIITVTGLLLRVKFLPNMGSYWFDEMASITIARLDFPKILEYFVLENTPPLSFTYLHFWIKLFGEGENITRISSLIFGMGAIPLTYLIGKGVFSKKVGLIASLFMSLSFFQIYYSVEARTYSLLLFLSLASIYFFWKTLEENENFWIFYFISSLLLIYTHLFGWLIIIFQNIFFHLYHRSQKQIRKNLYRTRLALAILFLPWLAPKIATIFSLPIHQGWFFYQSVNPLYSLKVLKEIILIDIDNKMLELSGDFLIVWLIITAFLSFAKQEKTKDCVITLAFGKNAVFVILWVIIPAIIAYSFNIFVSKYLIFVGPAIYLIIAAGISKLNARNAIIMTVAVSLFLSVGNLSSVIPKAKIYYWDDIAKYISLTEKPGDKIIIHGFMDILNFRQYYKSNVSYDGFYIFKNTYGDELEKTIIQRNWNSAIYAADNAIVNEKLGIMTKGYKRVFLIDSINDDFDPENMVLNWFAKNDWRLAEEKVFRYNSYAFHGKPRVWLWEKINTASIVQNQSDLYDSKGRHRINFKMFAQD